MPRSRRLSVMPWSARLFKLSRGSLTPARTCFSPTSGEIRHSGKPENPATCQSCENWSWRVRCWRTVKASHFSFTWQLPMIIYTWSNCTLPLVVMVTSSWTYDLDCRPAHRCGQVKYKTTYLLTNGTCPGSRTCVARSYGQRSRSRWPSLWTVLVFLLCCNTTCCCIMTTSFNRNTRLLDFH